MNCVSTSRRLPREAPRGYTLVEILIALAIATAFLGGLYATVIQILKQQEATEARAEAVRNGRTALSMMGEELKNGIPSGGNLLFTLEPDKLPYGDLVDNDGDGRADEDGIVDGQDGDGDWSAGKALRASFVAHAEYPVQKDKPQPGDPGVDEDCRLGHDKLTFSVQPETNGGTKAVSYYIGEYDGLSNVLLREVAVSDAMGTTSTLESKAPLAFGVLGFDVLCWDSNAAPADRTWQTIWKSTLPELSNQLRLPASVYLRLTMAADPSVKDGKWQGERPVQTLALETIVNLETVIGSPNYQRPTLK